MLTVTSHSYSLFQLSQWTIAKVDQRASIDLTASQWEFPGKRCPLTCKLKPSSADRLSQKKGDRSEFDDIG
jgi:hypothetical protein